MGQPIGTAQPAQVRGRLQVGDRLGGDVDDQADETCDEWAQYRADRRRGQQHRRVRFAACGHVDCERTVPSASQREAGDLQGRAPHAEGQGQRHQARAHPGEGQLGPAGSGADQDPEPAGDRRR